MQVQLTLPAPVVGVSVNTGSAAQPVFLVVTVMVPPAILMLATYLEVDAV